MPVQNNVQVKGDVPRSLKLRTFSALALRDVRFNHWLQQQMQRWLAEVEEEERTPKESGAPKAAYVHAE